MFKKFLFATSFLGLTSIAHAMIVYDPTNLLQNAATAANTAKQLEQTARELDIALSNIKNYSATVGQWANVKNLLDQLSQQVEQGQALAYSLKNINEQFALKFPGYQTSQHYNQDYQQWSQTALDTLRGTLDSASLQSKQFDAEQSSMDRLTTLSQGAAGQMQATQVGNMISTQLVAQMQKLRQLAISQVDAENTYHAYQIQKEQSAESALKEWLKPSNIQKQGQGFGQDDLPILHK